ncbi:hypothetical protein EEB14_58800, partial [Rhodococcus sp. WS4]
MIVLAGGHTEGAPTPSSEGAISQQQPAPVIAPTPSRIVVADPGYSVNPGYSAEPGYSTDIEPAAPGPGVVPPIVAPPIVRAPIAQPPVAQPPVVVHPPVVIDPPVVADPPVVVDPPVEPVHPPKGPFEGPGQVEPGVLDPG